MRGPYADEEYYREQYGGSAIPEDELGKALRKASRHIDALTYNRAAGRAFQSLTEYQQEALRECCCEMAEFEHENQDVIESVLQGYSINGVSMSFGANWNMEVRNGVAVRKECYERLKSTGLASRLLGR